MSTYDRRKEPCGGPDRRPKLGPEHEATRLLVASLQTHGRGEYPFYTSSYLRRMSAADRGMCTEDEAVHAEPSLPTLAQVWAAARRARLSPAEADLLRTLSGGRELPEAAELLGISKKRARHLLRRLAQKVFERLRDVDESLDQQIADVLRAEQARRGYSVERHCKPGQEACRRTGLCTRRWYLR